MNFNKNIRILAEAYATVEGKRYFDDIELIDITYQAIKILNKHAGYCDKLPFLGLDKTTSLEITHEGEGRWKVWYVEGLIDDKTGEVEYDKTCILDIRDADYLNPYRKPLVKSLRLDVDIDC